MCLLDGGQFLGYFWALDVRRGYLRTTWLRQECIRCVKSWVRSWSSARDNDVGYGACTKCEVNLGFKMLSNATSMLRRHLILASQLEQATCTLANFCLFVCSRLPALSSLRFFSPPPSITADPSPHRVPRRPSLVHRHARLDLGDPSVTSFLCRPLLLFSESCHRGGCLRTGNTA